MYVIINTCLPHFRYWRHKIAQQVTIMWSFHNHLSLPRLQSAPIGSSYKNDVTLYNYIVLDIWIQRWIGIGFHSIHSVRQKPTLLYSKCRSWIFLLCEKTKKQNHITCQSTKRYVYHIPVAMTQSCAHEREFTSSKEAKLDRQLEAGGWIFIY
jgi:hypothetical protein